MPLAVLSGPSGVGKGAVIEGLRGRLPEFVVPVSATTRAPRSGERDGEHYHFLSRAEFDRRVDANGFLEWAEYGGQRYGTLVAPVVEALGSGYRVILEIDVQGALQVRQRYRDAVLIMLAPPSESQLEARLRGRATDSDETIIRRMEIARGELAQASRFDHVVVNDDLSEAVAQVARILVSR